VSSCRGVIRGVRPCTALVILAAFSCSAGDPVPGRLPPGQSVTDGFPVYSVLGDEDVTLDEWTLSIGGLVQRDTVLDWDGFLALGAVTDTLDFHCVTGWSRLGDEWTGIPASEIVRLAVPDSAATAVMIHCADGYTTNLLLEDFSRDGVMLAFEFAGEPLAPEHGFPVRLIVPHLYAYKSAKWVTGIEFLPGDSAGYWEERGYHMRGDPWLEERFE
jgi:DMSO/TMAO reductase YedYZ molybdopterin-dependent catalytic subunit